jgi:DeoR/GlpR family transcriptional regulator of sugar metabolism
LVIIRSFSDDTSHLPCREGFGGAIAFSVRHPSFTDKLMLEHTEHMEEKRRIGAKAAEFIKSGDSIILDSGSTLTELVKRIVDRKNLNIITSAMNITLIHIALCVFFHLCMSAE